MRKQSQRQEITKEWRQCVDASNRIMDLMYAVFAPGSRHLAPVATVAEIIADSFLIKVPGPDSEESDGFTRPGAIRGK